MRTISTSLPTSSQMPRPKCLLDLLVDQVAGRSFVTCWESPPLIPCHLDSYLKDSSTSLGKIFPTSTGTWVSANTLRLNLKDRKAYLHSDSHVAKDLDAILIIGNPEVHAVATKVFGFQLVRPEEAWIRAIEFGELPRTDRLMRELMELHPKIAEIKFISLAYQGSLVGSEAAIWNPKNERDIHASEWKKSREKRFFQFEFLALNCANTAVYNALEIAQSEPEFAAYVLSKLLLARTGIPTETDDIWMKKVTTRRVARIGQ